MYNRIKIYIRKKVTVLKQYKLIYDLFIYILIF